jgi:nucleotide-binding universal stress UspA family protein
MIFSSVRRCFLVVLARGFTSRLFLQLMAISLLVPTDFHQSANRALDYATSLAGSLNAQLVLLHVRRDSVLDPEMFTGKLSSQSQEAVDLVLHSLVGHSITPAVAEIGHGRVPYAIAEAVSRHQPALVVLGRPDAGPVPDELVSTTALELLRTVPYPMLVVPLSARATSLPRRLLLAVDAEEFTLDEHAQVANHLFQALQAQLTVLHVCPSATDANDTAALDSVLRTDLAKNLSHLQTRCVSDAVPAEGILEAAASGEFDMVVVVARARSFLGALFHRSVTAQVVLHSPLPVLVLPAC